MPIFDRTGKKVVGFGGRILPSLNDDDERGQNFKPPKYLNSPETAVFHKARVLFGEHMVKAAIQNEKGKGASNSKSLLALNSDIIVVEGYMDVLSLSDVGISTGVASMGTAISLDQVNAAARLALSSGGRVIAAVCLAMMCL